MKFDIRQLFEDISRIKVGVIGDVMLDTYWWGHVDRISPEAPVPVVRIDKREQRIGGAGNVALNLNSLGATVSLLSVIGKDEDGQILRTSVKELNISDEYLLQSQNRITTNKIRIISRNQQMLRLDSEHEEDITKIDEDAFFNIIESYIRKNKPEIIILQDYNKGVLTTSLINRILVLCNANNIITAVDPKRKNFFSYQNVTLFKPNLKEVKESLNILSGVVNEDLLQTIHNDLQLRLHHAISLITLSEKGVFYKSNSNEGIIPSHIRNVADVSGAGDTVIAVAGLVYTVSKDVRLMAEIANIAGGLVCEEVGTAIINKEKLIEESIRLIN